MKSSDIAAVLQNVIDPELGIDIVSLGLVYGLGVNDSAIRLTMTVTTPDCPMASAIAQMAASRLSSVAAGREVFIEITEDPPWSVAMLNEPGRRQLGLA